MDCVPHHMLIALALGQVGGRKNSSPSLLSDVKEVKYPKTEFITLVHLHFGLLEELCGRGLFLCSWL